MSESLSPEILCYSIVSQALRNQLLDGSIRRAACNTCKGFKFFFGSTVVFRAAVGTEGRVDKWFNVQVDSFLFGTVVLDDTEGSHE